MTAELERLCPHCGHKSYGGGSTPRVKDGIVYRRRLCLRESCGLEFVQVEATLSENPILAEVLGFYHELCAGGPGGDGGKELLS